MSDTGEEVVRSLGVLTPSDHTHIKSCLKQQQQLRIHFGSSHFGSRAIVDRVSPCSSADCGWKRQVWVFSFAMADSVTLLSAGSEIQGGDQAKHQSSLWLCWFCRGEGDLFSEGCQPDEHRRLSGLWFCWVRRQAGQEQG